MSTQYELLHELWPSGYGAQRQAGARERGGERVVRRRVSEANNTKQERKEKSHSDETHAACAFAQVLCAARRAKYETHRQRRQTLLPWTPWWRANHRPNSSLLLHLQRLGTSSCRDDLGRPSPDVFFRLVPTLVTLQRLLSVCAVHHHCLPPARILSPRPTRTSSAR